MALDTSFMIAPSLEEYFVDKTTGLPLSGGKVWFYSDINRSLLKNIYTISGSPPNYSYVELPNPSTLSAVGTFQDAGNNNVLPYYFPYDADGNVENYYIEVYDSDGVLQFVREAFPNISSSGSAVDEDNAINYIPNGQFRLHNNIPATLTTEAGEITATSTIIAPGGWTFQRSAGSTAEDFLTFFEYGEYVEDPSASPQYACQIICSSPDSSTADKGIYMTWQDVNKFTSPTSVNQTFTFSFSGITVNSGNFNITLKLIKNFGTGGTPSATEITALTTFMITNVQTTFHYSFTFGNNDGTDIGTNRDSFVALELSLPTNISFGAQITNCLMFPGTVDIVSFPSTTDFDFSARSLTLLPLAFDGSQLGLPVVATLSGLAVDASVVGQIHASVNATEAYSFLCDGSQYLTSGYQSNGIPNARLQAVLYAIPNANGGPAFGTGLNFATAVINDSPAALALHNNTPGVASAVADGTVSTGFSFIRTHVGAPSYGVSSWWKSDGTSPSPYLMIWNNVIGAVTATNAGTSGFTVSVIRAGTGLTANISLITTTASAGLGGKYFKFSTTTTTYYVWYQIAGVGVDPAPGGTGILVNLQTGDTGKYVAEKTSNSVNGFETSAITVTAGSSVVPGSYFTFVAFGGLVTNYYVWYTVNGVGTDPEPNNYTSIKVAVLSADSMTTVQTKTYNAINSYYFAVPDLKGQYLVGNDPAQFYDYAQRHSFFSDNLTSGIGSQQLDDNLFHNHTYVNELFVNTGQGGGAAAVGSGTETLNTGFSGGYASNPYNTAVNYFIHY